MWTFCGTMGPIDRTLSSGICTSCLFKQPAGILDKKKADNENGSGVYMHSILYIYCLLANYSHLLIVNCSVFGSYSFVICAS